jgi:ABC-type polar amino acid transport system ATPase subunit
MIVVRDLVKRFGPNDVLRRVSLEVGKGEVAAVVGPSGGGKSTLLRCLNGLESFQGGEVRIGDLALVPGMHPMRDAKLLQRVRQRLGFVFQQFHLFPHRSVLENLIEAPLHVLRKPRAEAVAEARVMLERVDLAEKESAMPNQLSGGQQQRVAIARALLMRPEAVLFDEPTSALDPVMAGEVMAVIAKLAESGLTMIVVTHQIEFVRRVARTVHVLAEGERVEHGPPARVFEDPRHPTTRAFLAEARRTTG